MANKHVPIIFISFLLAACEPKEDPEIVRQLEERTEEVSNARAELKEIEARIKATKTKDLSSELVTLQATLEDEKAKQVALEKDIKDLEKAKIKADEDLVTYRRKYPLRSK